jgi:hypothetical protein
MAGYTKLFSDIVDSSIWTEDAETCKVWVTLLALSDANGYVRGSPGWLAGKSKVSLEKCELALEKFKKPDPQSRTKDNDGRRIEVLEDGWLVLNYIAFRERLSSDPKSVATRERVRLHRENVLRNTASVTTRRPASASASVLKPVQVNIPEKLITPGFTLAWDKWVEFRKKKKHCKDWPAMFTEQLQWLEQYAPEQAIEIINTSIRNDWQGLFEPKAPNAHKGSGPPRHDRNSTTLNKPSDYAGAAAKSETKGNLPGL